MVERIGEAKGSGLKKRDFKFLKIVKFDLKSVEDDEYIDCRICIIDYVDGDKVIILFCGYRYYKECIEIWLMVS